MNYKYDVFICYSSRNRDVFLKLKDEFIANDLKVFDTHEIVTGNYSEIIANAILKSKYFIVLLSQEFSESSYVMNEINFAFMESEKSGVKVIPVAIDEILNNVEISVILSQKPSLNYYFNRYHILKGSLNYVVETLLSTIKKEEKVKLLYKEADQAWIYGAYEQAYNNYLSLVDLVEGEAKLICYDRAANCCEKAGKWEEAKKLYHLSNNEPALMRLENSSKSKETIKPKEVNQELLYKIANYCDASIDLFYELLKDNQSPEGLNCLKTSYSRLLNYCKTIGGMDDVISSALSKMKESEKEFAKGNLIVEETKNDIIKQYRTYLGLEFPKSDNYDVFISYKSEDEMLARRVYDYLLGEGKRVFFACEVLPDMGKTEYRDAIMDALDHSQHFVLVTSKLDYITSNWVKEEWSFYVSKLIEDNHKGNLAIIIHDDFKVEKNQLPPNLRYKQRLLMSNFKESLLKYLQQ